MSPIYILCFWTQTVEAGDRSLVKLLQWKSLHLMCWCQSPASPGLEHNLRMNDNSCLKNLPAYWLPLWKALSSSHVWRYKENELKVSSPAPVKEEQAAGAWDRNQALPSALQKRLKLTSTGCIVAFKPQAALRRRKFASVGVPRGTLCDSFWIPLRVLGKSVMKSGL